MNSCHLEWETQGSRTGEKHTHSVSANVTGYVLVMLLLFVLHIDSVVGVLVAVSQV